VSDQPDTQRPHLIFLTTEDWYFLSHRLVLARDAIARGWRVSLATRIGDGRAALEAEGIEIIPLPWRRGGLPGLGDLRTLWRLVKLYRQTRPDIVHHVALKAALIGTLAARLAGVASIVNAIAGLGFIFTARNLRARLYRALFANIAAPLFRTPKVTLLFQNQDDRQVLCRILALDPDMCPIVRGAGVDLDRFTPQPVRSGPAVTVALVARMLRIKGVDLAVEAVGRARDLGANIRLQLVGPIDQANPSALSRSELDRYAGLPGVEYLGPRDDIAAIWAQADIALLPSRGGEGVPKALLEAAACARVLVGTDVAGIRDVVLDGVSGILVSPDDAHALAQALVRLAQDDDLRQRLGMGARSLAEDRFGQAQVIRRIAALHAGLLGKAKRRQSVV
jgi:glycosyltransferase involved in cell wall biosynthesis